MKHYTEKKYTYEAERLRLLHKNSKPKATPIRVAKRTNPSRTVLQKRQYAIEREAALKKLLPEDEWWRIKLSKPK